jgi:hypothetical protein
VEALSERERFESGNIPRDLDERTLELMRKIGSIFIEVDDE